MKIQGACHCRNISFVLDWPGEPAQIPVRACSCSFCVPRRATYTSHPDASLTIEVCERELLSLYRFGTKTADFYVCSRCGGAPVVTSEIDGHLYAVVNVHTFLSFDTGLLAHGTADFDGEGVTERLSRRSRGWIGDVIIVH